MSMFTTREAPWWQLGTVIDDEVTSAEAAQLGGMDFTVSLRPAGHKLTLPNGDAWIPTPNRFAVVANDNEEVFDFVSPDYALVQYSEAFAFMDQVHPRYVAAGTLRGRKQGFMVVQKPGLEKLDLDLGEHDPHELYIVLRTSHDRSRGIEIALMPLRNRCMNQLALQSFTQGVPQRWAIRHTGDPKSKMREALNVFTRLDNYVEAFERNAQRMANVDVELDEADHILQMVLPNRPKREQQKNAILTAWQESTKVGFAGTGWGLLNAISEYFEWGRDSKLRTPQSRFFGGLDGTTHKMTNRAATLLLQRR